VKNRISLLLGYWLIAFLFVCFFGAYGEGSFFPVLIFTSWAGLILRILSSPATQPVYKNFAMTLLFIVLYYVGLLKLTSKSVSAANKTWGFIPGAIHLAGGLAFILFSSTRRGSFDWAGQADLYIMSIVFSLILTLLWLLADWYLAMGDRLKEEPRTKQE